MYDATSTEKIHDDAEVLRRSLGWRLTHHARIAAAVRQFPIRDVLLAAQDPDASWNQDYYAPGREMRCRGDVAVVVHVAARVIVTVLWNNEERWTDTQAATRQVAT